MDYFKVRNFEEFQHYSKRNPPWIRLYYRILHDRNFYRQSDENKYLIIGFFLLASQHNNKIPLDEEWIIKELSPTKLPIDWQSILDSGFILPIDCDASAMLARLKKTCSQKSEGITDNSEGITEILSFSPKESAKSRAKEASAIFKHWNTQSATMHHRAVNGQEKAILKTLRLYSPEEINRAIERYSQVRANETGKYREVYAWTLGEFLTRKNHYNVERFNAEQWEEPFLTAALSQARPTRQQQNDDFWKKQGLEVDSESAG